jgi:hypothetical protein
MKAKLLIPAVALVVGWAGAAAAVEARGPIWDDLNARVTHTTYYSCNSANAFHGSLDIGNGTCSTWNMRGMLVGSFYWNVVSAYSNCVNSPQTPANYTYVNGASGYRFFQYHHNHNVSSASKTCDRCALGLVGATGQAYGAHVHAQNNQNSTILTAWYSGYVTCGSKSSGNHIMGYPRL